MTLSSVIVILNKIRTKQPTSSISLKLENMTFVWQLSSGSFLFSQTLQKCVYKVIVNRLKFLLALFEFVFIKLQLSLVICVNCNGRTSNNVFSCCKFPYISSSRRMPASLYAPEVVACAGIPRASLFASVFRLCRFFKLLFGVEK